MNVVNLVTFFISLLYYAAHTAAGCIYMLFGMVRYGVELLGPAVWAIPAVCGVLLVLDLTGRLSLRGSFAKTMAALALPALLGWGELLAVEDDWRFPGDRSWLAALLLLVVYVLLRKERGEGLDQAMNLLEQGSFLGIALLVWLIMLAGAVVFMATFGFLITVFIGALIAEQNSLLDYGGVKGILTGLLALYLLQCWWYWRGVRQARRHAPELRVNWLAQLIPLWNFAQARRLELQIRLGRVEIRKDRGVDHDDLGHYRPHWRGQDDPPAGGGEAGGRGHRL